MNKSLKKLLIGVFTVVIPITVYFYINQIQDQKVGARTGPTNLRNLSDVVITNATSGDAIIWSTSTSKWINGSVSADLSSYLTTTDAASTYLTILNASSTYLTSAIASSTYAKLAGAAFTGTISATNLSGTNTGDQDLSGYQLISLDGTPDSDHSSNGPKTSTFNSGYSSTVMDLVYMGSGGKWLATDADAAATSTSMLAIALEAKTDTQAMAVALPGSFVRDDTWNWTVGQILYVGTTTAGTIISTAPSATDDVVRVVGQAVTANVIYFNPSNDYITIN